LSRSRRGVPGMAVKGSYPAFTGKPARSSLKMNGKTSHAPKTAIWPRYAGFLLSHSKTVTFGFGILSLLDTRGSAKPHNVSLYPGYEKKNEFVTYASDPSFRFPKIWPCLAITVHTKGISASRETADCPFSRSDESDPPNTSCQRRPSVITNKICLV